MIVNQLIDTTKTFIWKKICLIKAEMKFNDTQTSYSNEQSCINYLGFNPFPSGHWNHDKDGGGRGSADANVFIQEFAEFLMEQGAPGWPKVSLAVLGYIS